jgi:hypothetical protein
MQVTVSLFGIIALIFVLHTVLQHFFNWFIRKTFNANYMGLVFVLSVILFFEVVVSLAIISQYLK